jgi:hypothetical protein
MKIARILLAAAVVATAAACSSDPTGIADRSAPQAPRSSTSATASKGIIGGVKGTLDGVTETTNSLVDARPCVQTEVIVNGIRTTVVVCEGDSGWLGGGT